MDNGTEKRQKCTMAAELLRSTLKQMNELMEMAEMEESPEHAKTMLYTEADIATHACEKLEELKKEYENLKGACPATLAHIDSALEEFEETKEEYKEFKEKNGGNPY